MPQVNADASLANQPNYYLPTQILSAKTQVVAGLNYDMQVLYKGSTCMKNNMRVFEVTDKNCAPQQSNGIKYSYGTQKDLIPKGSLSLRNLGIPVKMLMIVYTSMFMFRWYIYGGGFVGGNGNWGGEDLFKGFINKGPLVFVTINYRLGPMGFFTTRDPSAPGNLAISDWVEGLNWIHRYIKFFGGNANRLTIGGQSSGGEAVSTLSLTPVAKGLFNQMIIESGSAFGAALMSYSDRTRNTSLALAMQLGCATGADQWNSNNFPQIMSCLRSKSFSEVKAADDKLPNHRMKWALVQDNLYLPDRLENLAMKRPQLSVIIGDVHDEWMAWDMYFIQHNINSSLATRQGVKDSLKNSYEITYWDNANSVLNGANQAYNFDHEQFADDDHVNWLALHMQVWTEMVFIGPVLRDARYFAYTGSPTYLYSFDYLSPLAYPDITYPQLRGVPHGWEMPYIYNTSTGGINVGFNWPKLDNSNQNSFVSFTAPQVKVGPGFHPMSMYWACTAPTIDGYKPPFAC
ncbi:hypothetical protein WR25_12987 [Diploscapter pachys]|uniref:Carboxylic ester hydrolase n=1 Tax=Diploscapter pachys TaxID=2018661 RepID=A0A2A2LKE6_9BILA|nr:hypothetical protein WR25_12987 [Diploscapter pachys]